MVCTGPLRRSGGGHVRLLKCFGLVCSQERKKNKFRLGRKRGGQEQRDHCVKVPAGAEGLSAGTAAILSSLLSFSFYVFSLLY